MLPSPRQSRHRHPLAPLHAWRSSQNGAATSRGRLSRRFWIGLVAVCTAALSPAAAIQTSLAAPARVGRPAALPRLTPAQGTPHFPSVTTTVEQVRQLRQCGDMMYGVGTFSIVIWNGTTYTRNNAFSFLAAAPFTLSGWNPDVSGTVASVALSPDCSTAYLGGSFTKIGSSQVSNIAAVSTRTGATVKSFASNASSEVDTLLYLHRARHRDHLIVGGLYQTINNSGAGDRYMTSLSPKTGRDDGFIKLRISGHYEYNGVQPNRTRIYHQQLSPSKKYDLVEGDFTLVGGRHRQQIFMLDLTGAVAKVTPWTSPRFDGSNRHFHFQCARTQPFYVRAAAWSPDGKTVYLGTTGYEPWNTSPAGPREGLCDAAVAFSAVAPFRSVRRLWINYTGCDSLYSAAADGGAAYFAGHERWSENPDGCDVMGPGAINAPGIEGLSPADGTIIFNPTRSRGIGADDLLVTRAGLWIASDNYGGSDFCGGMSGFSGICLLPY